MTLPEVNLAQRLTERKKLAPPIDIRALAEEYAEVHEVSFPVTVDGVCLDLKRQATRPKILVNSGGNKQRQRFTLAHELGHVLIPWHVGSIVDETSVHHQDIDISYWQMEAEANRFASELLMPSIWSISITHSTKDPLQAIKSISEIADVSFFAARLKVEQCLPKGFVYARFINGRLASKGRSQGTLSAFPETDQVEVDKIFPHASQKWKHSTSSEDFYWWYFDDCVPLEATTTREWRDIFLEITNDIGLPSADFDKFKQRVSGVLSSANSATRTNRTVSALNSACIQRLDANATKINYLPEFIAHPKMSEFLAARISIFLSANT